MTNNSFEQLSPPDGGFQELAENAQGDVDSVAQDSIQVYYPQQYPTSYDYKTQGNSITLNINFKSFDSKIM